MLWLPPNLGFNVSDHRDYLQQLELCMFSEFSPGNPIWLPAGNTIYSILSEKIRQLNFANGYVEVKTPVLWKTSLYQLSGHLSHYKENMFIIPGDEDYALKPMNCPGHMLIFKSKQFSYRDLPYRLHDQGILHRNESSGAVGGLTRCRSFCQDDAHCFIKPEDIRSEISNIITMIQRVYKMFSMPIRCVLSTRPQSFMGQPETWDVAEKELKAVLEDQQLDFTVGEGEGAFYGPKIDFIVKDSLDREWQTATVQLDFQLPERFELEYISNTNERLRPIVIHRAMYGSFERFIGILLEHYSGALPPWLSPTQAIILTIADRHAKYAKSVAEKLKGIKCRVEVDDSNSTLNQKVLIAQNKKIPYIIVVGDKEEASQTLNVRNLDGKKSEFAIDPFARMIDDNQIHF